jgi:hypothetical protein
LNYLKSQAMTRAEALKPIDEFLYDKWTEVAEGLAELELKLADIKRRPVV